MKAKERLEARELRRQGWSVRDICKRLHVSKSSVSLWGRDIPLTAEQFQKLIDNSRRGGYLARYQVAMRNKEEAKQRHDAFRMAGYERARTDECFRPVCQ